MSDPTTHDAVVSEMSRIVQETCEPPIVAVTVSIGNLCARLLHDFSKMAKGMAEDGMTLADFGALLAGELEKGVTDDNPESGDKSDT